MRAAILGPRLLLVSFVVLAGCFERPLAALTPCTRARVSETIEIENVDNLDLLFVVDDSGSMAEEQSELIDRIPHLVQVLATGDSGLDGTIDFHPARSIHVGIVSSDMGTAAATGLSTSCTAIGDDGLLRAAPATCTGTQHGPVFDFEQGEDADAFASDVGCAADLGTMGCGLEQPLESMLKALTPTAPQLWTIPGYEPPTFLTGAGHGGATDANAGLVRDDSVLAIILISDENDTSQADASLYTEASPYTGVNLNDRGRDFPNALMPIDRYVHGLLGLRQVPSHLVFGAIVGVPPEAIDDHLTFDQILALDAMQEIDDPAHADRFLAACRGPFQTDGAYPGRRAVELARDLRAAGAGVSLASICGDSFEGALDEIIQLIGAAFRGTCLPRALNTDTDGRVACEVQEVLLPVGSAPDERTHCAALGDPDAYTLASMQTSSLGGVLETREVCRLRQLSRDELALGTHGWYYDDGPDAAALCPVADARRIAISGLTLVSGAQLRLVCDEHIEGNGTAISIGTFCNPGAAIDTCAAGTAPDHHTPLACDLFTRACAVPCVNPSSCTAAGLPGQQCDTRMAMEVFGDALPTGLDPFVTHDVCVNAICQ